MDNKEKYNQLICEYVVLIGRIKKQAKVLSDTLEVDKNSMNFSLDMASAIYRRSRSFYLIRNRLRVSSEVRAVASFIAYLFFDVKTEFISHYFNVTRSSVIHYCQNVSGFYLTDPSFRKNMESFFTEQQIQDMISKFYFKKRGKENGQKNGGH